MKTYMAIDQYGETYHDLGPHPRKELLRRLRASRADKQYADDKNGRAWHVGYVIRGLWLRLFTVEPYRKSAG